MLSRLILLRSISEAAHGIAIECKKPVLVILKMIQKRFYCIIFWNNVRRCLCGLKRRTSRKIRLVDK